MPQRLQLKTKLVVAISGIVLALVSVLSYVYVTQFVRQRINEAYDDGDFIAHQIYQVSRDALELDLNNVPVSETRPQAIRKLIEESLQTDPGLNALLQAIVGYAPTIYDVAIVDVNGNALLHSDSFLLGKPLPKRPDFGEVRGGRFWKQLKVINGQPQVYEVRLPLQRDSLPFGEVRVGISTLFLKSELQPLLNRTITFAIISILFSFAVAAVLSNFTLRPLRDIGARLDRMASGEIEPAPESKPERTDEYGVVNTKITRLGQQIRDVKEVFSALKENLDQIMANLQDGLMLFTRDWRTVLVSASAERFVGRARSDMLGRSVEEIFDESTRLGQLVLDGFHLHRDFQQAETETESGRRIQVSLDFIEEGGERIGALLTIRDAESVRKIEDEIELSRRLAAIGRLTSGVAHEVKNPINAIVLHLEVLREKVADLEPDARRHMDVIAKEIRRLDRVVQTLVDFTRPVDLRLVETDLRYTLDDVVLLAVPDAQQHGIRILRNFGGQTLPARVDADLIKQALLNVVINGVQAMNPGGTLTVSAAQANGEIEIRVHDEGPGIPPEIRDKIFNLYFTTKKGGSGIGLAMTYRVMQLHNGAVQVDSREGEGSTFILRLPAILAGESAPEATARMAESQ